MKVKWTAVGNGLPILMQLCWVAGWWGHGGQARRSLNLGGLQEDGQWMEPDGVRPITDRVTHWAYADVPDAPDWLTWGAQTPELVVPVEPPAASGPIVPREFYMLGPHFINHAPAPWVGWPVATLVDMDTLGMVELRGRCGDGTLFVWRATWMDHAAGRLVLRGKAGAREWWESVQGALLDARDVIGSFVVQGFNEWGGDLGQFAVFEAERLRILHDNGLRGGFGAFSVGMPPTAAWGRELSPILEVANPRDVRLAHAYWSYRRTMTNPWWFTRFTLEHKETPELKRWGLVLSEIGRDVIEDPGVDRRDWGKRGWKRSCSLGTFVNDLWEANRMLRPYGPEGSGEVLGATIYTGGQIFEKWQAFDCNEVYREMWGQG